MAPLIIGGVTLDRLSPEEAAALDDHLRTAVAAGRQFDPVTLLVWITLQQDIIMGLSETMHGMQNTMNGMLTVVERLSRDIGYIDPPPTLKLIGGPARDSTAAPRRPAG